MKIILLLSVIASTMIMAGGDIVHVEPIKAPKKATRWEHSGQVALFTQTVDIYGTGELFSGDTTYGALGLQLDSYNKNLFAGIGAGIEVSSIYQNNKFSSIPDTPNSFAFPYPYGGDAQVDSAALTQVYFTYYIDNTSIKVGRQTLPMSLSPFAFSEGWQMFLNTMEAALVVNTDLPDTKLVYATVGRANSSIGKLDNFQSINETGNGVHMITAQNKSIDNLALTSTYYLAPEMLSGNDVNIIWINAQYDLRNYHLSLQGGQLYANGADTTTAFGAKLAANFSIFNASASYSSVNNGDFRVTNLATTQNPTPGIGIKSPLYTQMVLNNIGNHQAHHSDWLKIAANTKLLGGTATVAYGIGNNSSPERGTTGPAFGKNPYEFDLIYKTKITKSITLLGAYVLIDKDDTVKIEDSNNFVRLWARYDF